MGAILVHNIRAENGSEISGRRLQISAQTLERAEHQAQKVLKIMN